MPGGADMGLNTTTRADGAYDGANSELEPVSPPNKFPCCIVWTPIPVITWLYPFIGHLGVCSTDGTIYDMAGFGVTRGNFAFGHPTKYIQLSPARASKLLDPRTTLQNWDAALADVAANFDDTRYNFMSNNCHHFVAGFLEHIEYAGRSSWSIVWLGALVFVRGRFVGVVGALKTLLPAMILNAVFLYIFTVGYLTTWALGGLALVGCMAAMRACFHR